MWSSGWNPSSSFHTTCVTEENVLSYHMSEIFWYALLIKNSEAPSVPRRGTLYCPGYLQYLLHSLPDSHFKGSVLLISLLQFSCFPAYKKTKEIGDRISLLFFSLEIFLLHIIFCSLVKLLCLEQFGVVFLLMNSHWLLLWSLNM